MAKAKTKANATGSSEADTGERPQPRDAALTTRASSINRALDQVGDKWCLMIIQEVFWGINTFSGMLAATGVSRGVLSSRLKWLASVDCLQPKRRGGRSVSYHLTRKSADLYPSALMAIAWERRHFRTPALDRVQLMHQRCGRVFMPLMCCAACDAPVDGRQVSYAPGPGATDDERGKKVRRRSSLPAREMPSAHNVYRNLVDIVGDRWTANIIALAFHGHRRFEQFHRELPIATNILSGRLKFLAERGIFKTIVYQSRPERFEYRLTTKGWDLFPYFLTLLQWGDRWCDESGMGPPVLLTHEPCGQHLLGEVRCDQCHEKLEPFEVTVTL